MMKKLNILLIAITALFFSACSQLSNKTVENKESMNYGNLGKVTFVYNTNTSARTLNASEFEDFEINAITLRALDSNVAAPIEDIENECWYCAPGNYSVEVYAKATLETEGDTTLVNLYGKIDEFPVEAEEENILSVYLYKVYEDKGNLDFSIHFDSEFYDTYINTQLNYDEYDIEYDENKIPTYIARETDFNAKLVSLDGNTVIPLEVTETWTIKGAGNLVMSLEVKNIESILSGFYNLELQLVHNNGLETTVYNFVLQDDLVEILGKVTNYQEIDVPYYKPIFKVTQKSTRYLTYKKQTESQYEVIVYPYGIYPEDINEDDEKPYGYDCKDFCLDSGTGKVFINQGRSIIYFDSEDNPKNINFKCEGQTITNYDNIAASNNYIYFRNAYDFYKADISIDNHGNTTYDAVKISDDDGNLADIAEHKFVDMIAYNNHMYICYEDGASKYLLDSEDMYSLYSLIENRNYEVKDMLFVDDILYVLYNQIAAEGEHDSIVSKGKLGAYKFIDGIMEEIIGETSACDSHYCCTEIPNDCLYGPVRFLGVQYTTYGTYIYIADEGIVCENKPGSIEDKITKLVSRVVSFEHTTCSEDFEDIHFYREVEDFNPFENGNLLLEDLSAANGQ